MQPCLTSPSDFKLNTNLYVLSIGTEKAFLCYYLMAPVAKKGPLAGAQGGGGGSTGRPTPTRSALEISRTVNDLTPPCKSDYGRFPLNFIHHINQHNVASRPKLCSRPEDSHRCQQGVKPLGLLTSIGAVWNCLLFGLYLAIQWNILHVCGYF